MEKVISKLLGLEISKLEDCSGLNTTKENNTTTRYLERIS